MSTIKFDAAQARRNRDEAIARVASSGKDAWLRAAKWAVYGVALTHEQFTTDEVWASGLPPCPTGSSRALGPVMMAAARGGVIERTDSTRNTTKANSHAQPLRVWRSRIFGP